MVGSTEAAHLDAECAESVQQASDELPSSFGERPGGDGDGQLESSPPAPLEGSFKTRLLAVFLAALISRRKVRSCPVLNILMNLSGKLDVLSLSNVVRTVSRFCFHPVKSSCSRGDVTVVEALDLFPPRPFFFCGKLGWLPLVSAP